MSQTFTIIFAVFAILSFQITAFPNFFPNISSIPPSFLPNVTTNPWESFNELSGCHTGQNLPGISKLKNYFHYFGYINNNNTSNFTDEFDECLESVVRNYQRNFNLNVTGELDQSTLNQMIKPRCGVADIVNGSSTMNSGKAESITGTVQHYTFFSGRPRWSSERRDLTYAFDPRNQLPDQVKRVFANAFMRWSEQTPFTFTEISNHNIADIKIGFYDGEHGDRAAFDGVLGTLAHASAPPGGLLHLDNAETWIIEDVSPSSSSSDIDLESVVVHEIGHVLGLGHSSIERAIMYPSILPNFRKVELHEDDIEGIQVLYGTGPDNNSTTAPLFGQMDTNGSTRIVSVMVYNLYLAVGLLFLLL